MHPFIFVLKLATLKKIPDKKTVLRGAAADGCTQLFEGFQMAFDKKRVCNVKSAPLIEIDETMTKEEIMEPGTYTWDMFKVLIGLLEKNELDDDTKKNLLYEVCEESGVLEWNAFYRPIIMKNLKCGVTAKTINAILDEFGADAAKYKTPVWKIQKISDNGLHAGLKYVEPVLTGKRAIIIVDKKLKTAKAYSETGALIKKPDIDLGPLVELSYQFPDSIVFDGNMIKRDYGTLMDKDGDDMYYAVYDILPLSDFNQSYCPMPLQERKNTLNDFNSILREETDGKMFVLPSMMLDFSEDNSQKKLQEIKDEAQDAGYKSIVLKDVNSHYTCEKDLSWFKTPSK